MSAVSRATSTALLLSLVAVVATYLLVPERYVDTLLGDLHARIDRHPFEWSLIGLIALTLLLRLRSQFSRIFGRPAWRKPDGSSSA